MNKYTPKSIILLIILSILQLISLYLITWCFSHEQTSGSWSGLGGGLLALLLPNISIICFIIIFYISIKFKFKYLVFLIFSFILSYFTLNPDNTLKFTKNEAHLLDPITIRARNKLFKKEQLNIIENERRNNYERYKRVFFYPQKIDTFLGNIISLKNYESFYLYGISKKTRNELLENYIEEKIISTDSEVYIRLPSYSKFSGFSINDEIEILLFDDNKLLNLLFLDDQTKKTELEKYQALYLQGKDW